MDLQAIQDAIHDAVVAGTGLAADKVLWAQQNAPRPAGTYVTLQILAIAGVGQDWDETRDNPASTGNDGQELEHVIRGPRVATLSVQCFGDTETNTAVGNSSPVAILGRLRAALRRPSVRGPLGDAGVGVGAIGNTGALGGVLGEGVFEPRAALEIRLHLAEELGGEFGTYIETVEVTNESAADTFTVDRDVEP